MGPIISPRQLAEAIGVSESSLKRWADDGQVRVSRTSGGHRRITVGEAIRFIRGIRAPLLKPELLGLRDLPTEGDSALSPESAPERLFGHLREGRAREARGLVISQYLEGQTVPEIADDCIRAAMARLGELWKHDQAGVFIEHRATDICIQAVEQLRQLVEPPTPHAVALGGALSGDPYLIPSLLAATALAAEGWQAVNLGPDTPFEALLEAEAQHKPMLVWISVSTNRDAGEVRLAIEHLVTRLSETGVTLALGGQALPDFSPQAGALVHRCQSIAELVAVAQSLHASNAPNPTNDR
jgi:methanogenic corrinoid protein MtbC1